MDKQITNISLAHTGAHAHARAHESAKVLNVLIACEESQAECKAFRELGHNAFSCDIQKCRKSGHREWHILGDVTPFLFGQTTFTTMDGEKHKVDRWNLIISHPPCTYLCKVSSVHLYKNANCYRFYNGKKLYVNSDRWSKMEKGRDFFFKCLNAQADYLAVENPIPMRCAQLPRPSFYACPSWFGVKYTKKTLYWVKNLPPIIGGCSFPNPKCFVRASRGKYRSRTFPELAKAIAEQWSEYILDDMPNIK